MKKIDKLLVKLKQITDTKNDKELCEKLDINYSTLDTWKNKDKIPEKRKMQIANKLDISFNDLIEEEENKTSKDSNLSKYFIALESVAVATSKENELIDDIKDLIKKYIQ